MTTNYLQPLLHIHSLYATMKIFLQMIAFHFLVCSQVAVGQNTESQDTGATIRGQLVLPEMETASFDFTALTVSIIEQVEFKPMPLPDTWATMNAAERQQWVADFRESEAGKKLAAENEALAEDRWQQPVMIDREGAFVVYDVPRGRYSITGEQDFERDGKKFSAQLYGDFEVGEVGEVNLSRMPLEILRVLEAGDSFPDFSSEGLDGEIRFSELRGKPTVVVFAVVSGEPFELIADQLRSLPDDVTQGIHLLVISLDNDRAAVEKPFAGIGGRLALIGSWDREFLNQFGILAVPSIWLVDGEGNVVMTDSEISNRMTQDSVSVTDLIRDFAAGKLDGNQAESDR